MLTSACAASARRSTRNSTRLTVPAFISRYINAIAMRVLPVPVAIATIIRTPANARQRPIDFLFAD